MTVPTLVQEDLEALLGEHKPPCLSVYMPTHRHFPENKQDPIRLKNLIKTLQESLLREYSSSEAEPLLKPFRSLEGNRDFWIHAWEGLAILASGDLFRVIKLHRPVPELAVVADSFHIKPLLRLHQSADRYQVLRLNRHEIALFEGNRDHLDEVQLAPGVPRTVQEALGDQLTDQHRDVYGGTSESSSVHFGQGAKRDEIDTDQERFFRAVDRPILEHHSKPSGLPLILAALTEHQTPFRQLSHNPFLMAKGIEIDAGSLTSDQLRERAWALFEPEFRARLAKLVESFGASRAKDLGTDDIARIAEAAVQSRVGVLLVEAERKIPGRLDPETGAVTLAQLSDPHVDDLLDDLAELVLSRGGQVVVVPAADMPSSTGAAATFRF